MGTGTDVAIESAKITLVKGDLQGIVKKKLSHAVMKNINQNFFCLLYNVLGINCSRSFISFFSVFT
jgi:Cu2+-exporting ATPase